MNKQYLVPERPGKSFSKTFFSIRKIADAVGLTIYQTREYLEVLHSSRVVEKVNSVQERAGQRKPL
ncbi:hypothetical protein OCS73_000929 [Escherichia coli]|nr:hypothetical protein [Escherichia coli]